MSSALAGSAGVAPLGQWKTHERPPPEYWNLDPVYSAHVKVLAAHLHQLEEADPQTGRGKALWLGNHPIRRLDVVGVVVESREFGKGLEFKLDDGTGLIKCVLWDEAELESRRTRFGAAMRLGATLRVLGTPARDRHAARDQQPGLRPPRQIAVESFSVDDDPAAQCGHWHRAQQLWTDVYSVSWRREACRSPGEARSPALLSGRPALLPPSGPSGSGSILAGRKRAHCDSAVGATPASAAALGTPSSGAGSGGSGGGADAVLTTAVLRAAEKAGTGGSAFGVPELMKLIPRGQLRAAGSPAVGNARKEQERLVALALEELEREDSCVYVVETRGPVDKPWSVRYRLIT